VAIGPSDPIGNGHFTQELIGSKENPFQSIQKKLKTSLKAIEVKAAHKSPEVTQLVTTKFRGKESDAIDNSRFACENNHSMKLELPGGAQGAGCKSPLNVYQQYAASGKVSLRFEQFLGAEGRFGFWKMMSADAAMERMLNIEKSIEKCPENVGDDIRLDRQEASRLYYLGEEPVGTIVCVRCEKEASVVIEYGKYFGAKKLGFRAVSEVFVETTSAKVLL
jgi:hypothetical protein